jgi:peptidoglycan hydrolase-like protein with peptidoglycan-binding domain
MPLQWSQSGPLLSAAVSDHGPDIRALQIALARAGSSVTADGKMGPGTMAAVRAWQKKAKLSADGLPGANTWDTLRAAGHTKLDDVATADDDLTNMVVSLRNEVIRAAAIDKDQVGMTIVAELDRDLGLPLAALPSPSVSKPKMGVGPAVGIVAAIGAALVRMGPRALPVIARFAGRSATYLRGALTKLPKLWSGSRKVQLPSGSVTITGSQLPAQSAARGGARLAARLVNWLGAGLGLGAAVSTVATVAPDMVKAAGNHLLWLIVVGIWALTRKR